MSKTNVVAGAPDVYGWVLGGLRSSVLEATKPRLPQKKGAGRGGDGAEAHDGNSRAHTQCLGMLRITVPGVVFGGDCGPTFPPELSHGLPPGGKTEPKAQIGGWVVL